MWVVCSVYIQFAVSVKLSSNFKISWNVAICAFWLLFSTSKQSLSSFLCFQLTIHWQAHEKQLFKILKKLEISIRFMFLLTICTNYVYCHWKHVCECFVVFWHVLVTLSQLTHSFFETHFACAPNLQLQKLWHTIFSKTYKMTYNIKPMIPGHQRIWASCGISVFIWRLIFFTDLENLENPNDVHLLSLM